MVQLIFRISIMSNHRIYISDNDFERIYIKIVDQNDIVVKLAIQEFISKFEQNKVLSNHSKQVLCSVECAILKRKSNNLRKWAYHLAFYCNNNLVLNVIYKNITTGFENNLENITWGLAILSKYPQYSIDKLYKQFFSDKLSLIQFKLCTTAFSKKPIFSIDTNDIKSVLDSEDSLSKIWLTKTFVCPINKINCVNYDTMNVLLEDSTVKRYALWAFSTEEKLDVKTINISANDIATLDNRSIGWYYVCLFKDYQYILKNQDHLQAIFEDFFEYPEVVKLGILKGILFGNYENFENLEYLVFHLLNTFSSIENIDNNYYLLSIFIAIFLQYSDRNEDIKEFTKDIYRNSRSSIIKNLFINYLGANTVGKYEFEAKNVQIIEKADTVNQYNDSSSDIKEYNSIVSSLEEKIKNNIFDNIFDDHENIQAIIVGIETQLRKLSNEQKGNKEVKKLIKSFEKFKNNTYSTEKKKSFLDFLSVLSNICTIANTIPNIVLFIQGIVPFLQSFFIS